MSILRDKYKMGNVDFFNIRNRNESRVLKALQAVVQKRSGELLSVKDLQDIYALALNMLPPRYIQRGTIVLRDPVTKREIHEAVEDAYDKVVDCPKV